MYTYREACRYIDGKWDFKDIEEDTINKIISESRYNLITVNISGGGVALITPNVLLAATDKTIKLKEFIDTYSTTIPELEEDIEIKQSKYFDIDGTTRIGSDYILQHDIPFVISRGGLWEVSNKIARDIHPALNYIGCTILGALDVGLDWKKHSFTYKELANPKNQLPKRFSHNNTILIFGDSIIKVNTILEDIGDSYTYKDCFRKVIADLYIDNIDKIPPSMVGIKETEIYKSIFNDNAKLAKIMTHPSVFFVEYQYEYPLGLVEEFADRGIVAEYSDSLLVCGNKPTICKVIHRRDRYEYPEILAGKSLRHYLDNTEIPLITKDNVLVRRETHIYGLDYPVIKMKAMS